MHNRTFIQELKYQVFSGSMTNRLIIVNVCVFILLTLFTKICLLYNLDPNFSKNTIHYVLDLNSSMSSFLQAPWGIVTSIFTHEEFSHLFFNMLFLYFSGRYFEQYFSKRKLWQTYLIGGIAGGLFEIIANNIFPALQGTNTVIVGASGSIMAIFTALAFFQPNIQVNLFGIFPIRIYFLALFFLFKDLVNIGSNDHIAHFAHLGGAIFGLFSIQNLHTQKNILNMLDAFFRKIRDLFKWNKKVQRENTRFKTDVEYNQEKRQKQEKIDQILDKISKSGYDSLSKSEKEFLFNQSKNG